MEGRASLLGKISLVSSDLGEAITRGENPTRGVGTHLGRPSNLGVQLEEGAVQTQEDLQRFSAPPPTPGDLRGPSPLLQDLSSLLKGLPPLTRQHAPEGRSLDAWHFPLGGRKGRQQQSTVPRRLRPLLVHRLARTCLAAVSLPVPTRPAGTAPVPGLLGRQQLPCSAFISTPGTFSTTLKSRGRAGSRPHPSLLMDNLLRKIGKAVN